jgi:hypothetical protein
MASNLDALFIIAADGTKKEKKVQRLCEAITIARMRQAV